jgi:exodeoxyribonuclease VII small subunit
MSNLNYEEAFAELQAIVAEMESGTIGVDVLANKVKRAAELMRICKTKLQQTEVEVQQLLDDLAQFDQATKAPNQL